MRSKTRGTVFLTALTLAVCVGPTPATVAQEEPVAAGRTAAMGALEHSLALVRRSKSYELLGLESRAELDRAELGSALEVREIGYDLLLKFEDGTDPESVFTGPEQLLYPVTVGGEIRSAISLVKVSGAWQVTGYGDATRARAIHRTKLGLDEELADTAGEYYLISVPAFQLTLVASKLEDKTVLRPLSTYLPPELDLEGLLETSELVRRLSEYAKEFDALYGDQIREQRLVD